MRAILGFVTYMLPWMLLAGPFYLAARWIVLARREKKVHWRHEAGMFCFALFCVGLASLTVMPRLIVDGGGIHAALEGRHETKLLPLRVICYTYRDIVAYHSTYSLLVNLVGNIVMFMPFGFFLPLLWRMTGRRTLAVGMCVSLFIETVQLFLPRSTDIDDLILNTAGTALGLLFYRALGKFAGKGMESFRYRD